VELVGSYYNHNRNTQKWQELLDMQPASRTEKPARKRKHQVRLRADQLETFKRNYQAGLPIKELADKYQINRATVYQHISRLRLPRRYPRVSPAQVAEAAGLYQSGWSLATLGDRFGVAQDTVALALTKAGVTLRPRPGR